MNQKKLKITSRSFNLDVTVIVPETQDNDRINYFLVNSLSK